MNNSTYLKKYVRNHPDNKMAWYLLGKEYEASGQEGKAHYCYIQAGSVYEAFEASKVPADLWREYQDNLIQESKRKEAQKRSWRRAAIVLMLLLLMSLPQVHAPGQPVSEDLQAIDQAVQDPLVDEMIADELPEKPEPSFTAQKYFNDAAASQAGLAGLLNGSKGNRDLKSDQQVVLGMDSAGSWALWSRTMPVVYAVTKSHGQGLTTVQSYDDKACDCEAPDAGQLQEDGERWITRQESLAVLASAMRNYKQSTGDWPNELDDLIGKFPDNWLAGSDETMERAFLPLLSGFKGQPGNSGGASAGDEEGSPTNAENPGLRAEEPFLTEPIEVLVDPANHQLAVVSGQTILRSYKVGLGGSRTPEGSFQISDKVVNPNGRDDGEFGSRGMQLSDSDYAIHGTDEPESIGKDESLGCIRMDKGDIEELFDMLPKGTKVTIKKGILPKLVPVQEERFALKHRQDQTNPRKTYRWL